MTVAGTCPSVTERTYGIACDAVLEGRRLGLGPVLVIACDAVLEGRRLGLGPVFVIACDAVWRAARLGLWPVLVRPRRLGSGASVCSRSASSPRGCVRGHRGGERRARSGARPHRRTA